MMSMATSRAAAREAQGSERQAQEVSWPLPIGGLMDDASTADISGAYAIVMDNWISNGMSLETRDGTQLVDASVYRQRIPYEFGASPKYLGVGATTITDGTTTFTRTFGENISYTHISANALMADGAGPVIRYDGTAFSEAAFTTSDGKDPDEFTGVFSHQDRPYLWDESEPDFYYGDVGAVTGAVTKFPLSRLGNITGNIKLITSMTFNAMHGMNDILAIMTTTGWIILYEGLDPGDANDWRLLGRVKVSAPVSQFAVQQFGPELWVLTSRGLVSIQDTLNRGKIALNSSVGGAITDLLNADVKANKSRNGWGMTARQDGTQLLLNVPTADGFKQYVYESDAKAWQTADYPARVWHDLEDETHFTDPDGAILTFDDTGGDSGEDITAIFHTAWFRLPRHSSLSYLIPTIIADGNLDVRITVLTDNDETANDIEQGTQVVRLRPDNPGSRVSLNDVIGVNAAGRVYQARFEITGRNIVFRNLLAGLV